MKYSPLGSTGIQVSAIAFGAGPVSQLLTGDNRDTQRKTIQAAVDAGINWFDTAATYGDGRSEENLGRTLSELRLNDRVHVASKVRVMPHQWSTIGAHVRDSLLGSLRRLRLEKLTLLQVHNSLTEQPGAEPTSITPAHVLGSGGLLEELRRLQQDGLVDHLGLTGLGDPSALAKVIASGFFATIQTPYHLLNPSAGQDVPSEFSEVNYGNMIGACAARGMGVFAIRILAGGTLAGQPPSPHTLKTPFFPLDLYQRDCHRAEQLAGALPPGLRLEEAAVRFALGHTGVTSAIIGCASPEQVGELVRFAAAGPLDASLLARLNTFTSHTQGGR